MVRVVLSREQLLAPRARRVEIVETPELDGDICIRALTAPEAMALWQSLDGTEDYTDLCVLQVMAFVSDEEGKPAFQTREEAERFLDTLSVVVACRIIEAGKLLNSVGDRSVERAEGN